MIESTHITCNSARVERVGCKRGGAACRTRTLGGSRRFIARGLASRLGPAQASPLLRRVSHILPVARPVTRRRDRSDAIC